MARTQSRKHPPGIDRIAAQRARLTSLRHSQDLAYRKAEETQTTLSRQQAESEKMVTSLRKEDSALRAMLKEQKRKSAALDRELDRLIAAEQARIARARKPKRARREREKEKQSKRLFRHQSLLIPDARPKT